MAIINLPTSVTPVNTPYSLLPQPAAAVHENLIPPYNITINENGEVSFSVAVLHNYPAPTSVEYIPNNPNQNGYNTLKVICAFQPEGPRNNSQVSVYTYDNIELGTSIPLNTNVYPVSYASAPGGDSQTNGDPETSRGTVVIVKGGDGDTK